MVNKMELNAKINEKLKSISKDLAIFDFLKNFTSDNDDVICLECISNLVNDLTLISESNVLFDNGVINKVENDLITLDDLINEFKTLGYSKFNIEILSLISSFGVNQIKKMTNYISDFKGSDYKNRLCFEIFKTIDYFPSDEYRLKVKEYLNKQDLTYNDYELIILSIRKNKKDLKSEGLEIAYLELMAIFIAYLCEKDN